MRRVVFNQKGGVGKSSITCNLAAISAARGKRTLRTPQLFPHSINTLTPRDRVGTGLDYSSAGSARDAQFAGAAQ